MPPKLTIPAPRARRSAQRNGGAPSQAPASAAAGDVGEGPGGERRARRSRGAAGALSAPAPARSRKTENKIQPIRELSRVLAREKNRGKTVVLCHGVFDLVHLGHIRHLEAAKREGDVLVVTITPDEHVNKGPGHPVFNQRLRAETLAALQNVDFVAVNEWPTSIETIRLLRPDVYVKGSEYAQADGDLTGAIRDEEQAVLSVGGRIHFTDEITFSSSHLLNAHFNRFPPETEDFLAEFRRTYRGTEVIDHLRQLADLNVLVLGDSIIDEYHFCRPYGMASKSSAIAAQFVSSEAYAGGALAVANHLAGFCRRVNLVTCLGEQDSRQEFIARHLKPNVSAKFFFRPDTSTVVKRRYVHGFLVTKLFEVSFFNGQPLPASVNEMLHGYLANVIEEYDLVVVADFGHGMIGGNVIDLLCQRARYLAVNAQLNSMNFGYNVVAKYPRTDYVCIDEEEARMSSRDRYGALEPLVERLAETLRCRMITVTRGYHGSVTYQPDRGLVKVPVLAREVVDTIGAGDAYLAVTAPCACKGFPAELIGFIGNAVGALAVRFIGNKESIEPVPLFKFITALLK